MISEHVWKRPIQVFDATTSTAGGPSYHPNGVLDFALPHSATEYDCLHLQSRLFCFCVGAVVFTTLRSSSCMTA